ncbi:MAG TPA: hypothetical protein VIH59_11165, partial [Candidatus Tectomicrobia bacterium]
LPLIVRFNDRLARYQALWDGTDFPSAVSIFIKMVEASLCFNQVRAAQGDRWASSDITPLPHGYWDDQSNRAGLLRFLIAAGVLATCLYSDSPLPVNEWLDDVHLQNIAGPDVDRFFTLLTGSEVQTDGSLLEEVALALRRVREETLLPKELCVCHFRLLNALCSGEWGKSVGDALAKIVAAQWVKVSEHQRFALTSPALYAPMLKKKCEDVGRSGFSKVASILKTATVATGVRLADSVIEFLTHVERGEGIPTSSA